MKTICILYENNGAGHKRAAELIEQMLARRDDCRTVSVAGSEFFNDPAVDVINRLWVYFVRKHWIRLADSLINFHLRAWILPIMESLQVTDYHRKLDELAPDAIVCTADGFGKLLGLYAKNRAIPLYIVITEFSTFADLVNPMATHICYFPDTMNAIHSYDFDTAYFSVPLDQSTSLWEKIVYVAQVVKDLWRAGGVRSIYRNIDREHEKRNDAKCLAVGPMVEETYYSQKNKSEVRKKLNIQLDKPCVLIISGSIGGDYLYEVITAFQERWSEPVTLLAICGRDDASFRILTTRSTKKSNIELIPFGFVDNMEEMYAAADVVIARPSASVFIEAMMQRVPILIPSRATANDLGGAELVKRHFLGEVYDDAADIPGAFKRMFEKHSAHIDAINRFLSVYPADFETLQKTFIELILGESERPDSTSEASNSSA